MINVLYVVSMILMIIGIIFPFVYKKIKMEAYHAEHTIKVNNGEFGLFKRTLLKGRLVYIDGAKCVIDKANNEYFWVIYTEKEIKIKLSYENFIKLLMGDL